MNKEYLKSGLLGLISFISLLVVMTWLNTTEVPSTGITTIYTLALVGASLLWVYGLSLLWYNALYVTSKPENSLYVDGKHAACSWVINIGLILSLSLYTVHDSILAELCKTMLLVLMHFAIARLTLAFFLVKHIEKAVTWKDLMWWHFSKERKTFYFHSPKWTWEVSVSGLSSPNLEVGLGGDENRFFILAHCGLFGINFYSQELFMIPYGKLVDCRLTGIHLGKEINWISLWHDDGGYSKGWEGLHHTWTWERFFKGQARNVEGRTIDAGWHYVTATATPDFPTEEIRIHVQYVLWKTKYSRWLSGPTRKRWECRLDKDCTLKVPSEYTLTDFEFTTNDDSVYSAKVAAAMCNEYLRKLRY